MNKVIISVLLAGVIFSASVFAGDGASCPAKQLVITAKLTEIPGTGEFTNYPKSSVYYYHIDVLRYEVVKVLQGDYDEEIIMVGQYIPLVARAKIKDKMDKYVDGDLEEFRAGDIHQLTLDMPIKKYYDRDDAVFDDYFDDEEGDRYYALRTDLVTKKGEK